MDERRVGLDQCNGPLGITGSDRPEQLIEGRGSRRAAHRVPPALLLAVNDGDDVVIAAFGGDGERAGRVAMGIDAFARVGSKLHEQADHVRRAMQDGVVQDLQVAGGHSGEFGAALEQLARLREVVGADGVDKASDSDTVNMGLELRPALESVGAGQDKLRVVQSEAGRVRAAVEGADFGRRVRFAGGEGFQQLFGLAFELTEIGALGKRAGGKVRIHNELLTKAALWRGRYGPVSARSGGKEFIARTKDAAIDSGGLGPSRGHGGVLTRLGHFISDTGDGAKPSAAG